MVFELCQGQCVAPSGKALYSKLFHSKLRISSVASPICQEGQSERTFPILAFSSRFFLFFPDFSRFLAKFLLSGVALCPPLHPQWLRHWCGWEAVRVIHEILLLAVNITLATNSLLWSKSKWEDIIKVLTFIVLRS